MGVIRVPGRLGVGFWCEVALKVERVCLFWVWSCGGYAVCGMAYAYVSLCMYVCTYACIYIYICREREAGMGSCSGLWAFELSIGVTKQALSDSSAGSFGLRGYS